MSDELPSGWRAIGSAPRDAEILVYTRAWGPIIAVLSAEFGEWLSRMQVPVSIKEAEELPTHWQPLPEPPPGLGEAKSSKERDGAPDLAAATGA